MRKHIQRVSRSLWLVAAVVTLAGCPLFPPNGGGSPQLRVIPAAFEFTDALRADSFTITNGGSGILSWQIDSIPSWLRITSAMSGSISNTQSARVTLETDTSDLEDGLFTGFVVVTSNGGRAEIPVVLGVGGVTIDPSIRVTPASLDFGATDTQRTLEVRNGGVQGEFVFTATASEPWITGISPSTGTVSTAPVALTVEISRDGLSDGDYEAVITVSAPDLDPVEVPVRMRVAANTPVLSVAPTALDFGGQTNTRTATIRNTGGGLLSWEVVNDIPWLQVTPTAGTTTTESDVITVRIDRTGLPAGAVSDTFIVRAQDGQEVPVTVSAEVLSATLVVTPTTLDYGATQNTKLITITNGGIGSITWSIDAASLPSWLSVSQAAGVVSGNADAVLVTVNRSGLPPQVFNASFTVSSNAGNRTVSVAMSVLQPTLQVRSNLLNSQGLPATAQGGGALVDLGTRLNTASFTITNIGTGVLNWEIDPKQFQDWFSLSPVQGSLLGGQSDTVNVTVTREGPFGGASATLVVKSNAGNGSVTVARTIPKKAALGTDVSSVSLGTQRSSAVFFVANFGDEGTNVEYEIESDRDWLFASPATGASQGTASPPPFKDFRQHTLFVDRSRLGSNSGTGTLTIRATGSDTNEDVRDIPTASLQVTVEATPLTFEQALYRGRRPSMVRFTFTMRDIAFNTITTPIDAITADAFTILEDGLPLDLDETNIFLTDQYEANIVLALDYSGSMQAAAAKIINSANPLQDLYEATVPGFLNALDPRYRVALLAFFDRDQSARLQSDFTRDRGETLATLQNLRNTIITFGATELLPAFRDSALLLNAEPRFNVPFDDPDVRAVVVVSDGRGTTPPGDASEFVEQTEFTRARFFNVAWGLRPDFGISGVVASETGGHFYLAPNTFDADGEETPSQQELADRLLEVAADLRSQYLLTFIALNEDTNPAVRVTAAFDPPEDDGTPLDQGVIQGSFEQEIPLGALTGDTRLGQISMRSDGIQPDGSAEIILHADYIPREIEAFSFTITAGVPFFVERIAAADGGLVADWALAQAGNVFTLTAPDGPLPYGSFGPLLRLVFDNAGGPTLEANLAVNNALYSAPPGNPRFFIAPSVIRVLTGEDALAPSFPTPEIDLDPATPDDIPWPLVLDIPATDNTAEILIRNVGGVYLPTFVWLNWEIASTPDFVASAFGPNNDDFGSLTATRQTALIRLILDRNLPPGFYSAPLEIEYDTGTLGYAGRAVITVRTSVLPPALEVETPGPGTLLDFGDAADEAVIVVRNTGQSILNWEIDTAGFPEWLSVQPTSGAIGAGGERAVTISVDRTGLAPGAYGGSFTVTGAGDSVFISVSMEVP